jgi:hypothetical protein
MAIHSVGRRSGGSRRCSLHDSFIVLDSRAVKAARVAAIGVAAAVLAPTIADAAHVYRFHLVRSTSASEIVRKCEGSSLVFPWKGRKYRPTGRVRCVLSDGDREIGWRQLTISSTYRLPLLVGSVTVLWKFAPVGYHAVSGTYAYCIPGYPGQPGDCQTRRLSEKGSQWSNVW